MFHESCHKKTSKGKVNSSKNFKNFMRNPQKIWFFYHTIFQKRCSNMSVKIQIFRFFFEIYTKYVWKNPALCTKGVVFFYFPGKDTFRMIFGKKEWVSEISGIFFFHSGGKKKIQTYFSPRKKSRVIFPQNCIF